MSPAREESREPRGAKRPIVEDFLKGKKTYLVAAISLIAAIAAWANGYLDVPEGSILAVLIALGTTLRAAISKVEPKKKP